MAITTQEQWQKLYHFADEIYKIKPWGFLYEDQIIKIVYPKTNIEYYVSVMGSAGEHFSVTAYEGDQSLNNFHKLLNSVSENEKMQLILETTQVILSFENNEFLEKEDKKIIKDLDLKYRGKKAYPCFRIQEPGYLRARPDSDQADLMIFLYEKCLQVLSYVNDHKTMEKGGEYGLPEIQSLENAEWIDVEEEIQNTNIEILSAEFDQKMVDSIKKLPFSSDEYVLFSFIIPMPILEKKPIYGYSFLILDTKTSMIVYMDTIAPKPDLRSMYKDYAKHVEKFFKKIKHCPKKLIVTSEFYADLLVDFFNAVEIYIYCKQHKRTGKNSELAV
ncbi:MAG TPA: hypothetical protein PK816_00765 [Candidatus Cloacimonadota bacterium]|nr:hypothetical protein [Candidatus Cloacimonadota bacterium]